METITESYLSPLELIVLEAVNTVGQAGLRPSQLIIPGYTSGEIRSASLALATKGRVIVNTNWRMIPPVMKKPTDTVA